MTGEQGKLFKLGAELLEQPELPSTSDPAAAPAAAAAAPRLTRVCWCCAVWGISTEATRRDQGADPGWLCGACADSSPSACNKRHGKAGGGPR